jgi:hypothetical protein
VDFAADMRAAITNPKAVFVRSIRGGYAITYEMQALKPHRMIAIRAGCGFPSSFQLEDRTRNQAVTCQVRHAQIDLHLQALQIR